MGDDWRIDPAIRGESVNRQIVAVADSEHLVAINLGADSAPLQRAAGAVVVRATHAWEHPAGSAPRDTLGSGTGVLLHFVQGGLSDP